MEQRLRIDEAALDPKQRECPGWVTIKNTAHSVDASNFLPQFFNYLIEDLDQKSMNVFRITSYLGNHFWIYQQSGPIARTNFI